MSTEPNILDVIFMIAGLLLFGGFAIVGMVRGQIVQAVVTSVLALLTLIALISALNEGVRRPTAYEIFRAWMTLRPVIIGVVGLGLLAFAVQYVFPATLSWPQAAKVTLVLVPLLIWAGLIIYTIGRAPRRHEADAAYRRRVGYKPKE